MLERDGVILTTTQMLVLEGIFQGKSNKQIGNDLDTSQFTVKNHIQHVLRKLQVHNRIAAIRRGLQLGLLTLPPSLARPENVVPLQAVADPVTWFKWRNLELCPEMGLVRVGRKILELRRKQFQLLHMFLTHPNIIHSHDSIIDRVWGGTPYEDQVVGVAITGLRKVLGRYGYGDLIVAVRGEGYVLSKKYVESSS